MPKPEFNSIVKFIYLFWFVYYNYFLFRKLYRDAPYSRLRLNLLFYIYIYFFLWVIIYKHFSPFLSVAGGKYLLLQKNFLKKIEKKKTCTRIHFYWYFSLMILNIFILCSCILKNLIEKSPLAPPQKNPLIRGQILFIFKQSQIH